MEFRVLGPVEVLQDGHELPLGGPKQRVLLALLLLDANEPVSRDRLIDGLWGERPPPSAGHTLDTSVSRMRKTLGKGRLVTRTPGYLLRVEPGELDLDRFELLYRSGHEALVRGAADEAADALRSALRLWRGPALANVLYEPFGTSEAERLEERRLLALEDRIDADLELGRCDELIPELEALVRDHPLREHFLGQLMLALYRSGRQAEALAALQAARHRLAEELGLEPGPHLRELERQILQHDPALAVPRARIPDRRLRWPAAVGLGATAITAAAVIGVVLGVGQTTTSRPAAQNGDTLVSVNARSGRIGPGIALGGGTTAMKAAGGSVWLVDPSDDTISRVNAATATVVDRIPVGGGPGDLAVGGGSVWVASTFAGTVSRIDPATGAITQTVHLGGNPSALAYGTGDLWVADSGAESLTRVDSATGKAGQSVSLAVHPSAVALGAGAVWVASHDAGTVTEIDPSSGATLATVPVGQGPAALALGAGSVWVANELAGTVSRIDPKVPKVVATVVTGSGPSAVAFAAGAVWVANEFSGDLSRIDPRRNTVKSVHVGGRPSSLAAGEKAVWVARGPLAQHRGGTLRLLSTGHFVSLDPAFSFQAAPLQWLGLSNDTLVTFEHVSGPDGLHLVPDLAAALPHRRTLDAPTRSGSGRESVIPTDDGFTRAIFVAPLNASSRSKAQM